MGKKAHPILHLAKIQGIQSEIQADSDSGIIRGQRSYIHKQCGFEDGTECDWAQLERQGYWYEDEAKRKDKKQVEYLVEV